MDPGPQLGPQVLLSEAVQHLLAAKPLLLLTLEDRVQERPVVRVDVTQPHTIHLSHERELVRSPSLTLFTLFTKVWSKFTLFTLFTKVWSRSKTYQVEGRER